jgi:two-component system, NarL family, response regulator NreC
MITTLLADDHVLVRQGLRSLLENAGFQVVGEASDGHQAVAMAQQLLPEIAILDVGMPVLNGVDAARQILTTVDNGIKVILLTMYTDTSYVVAALSAGVHGYVLKSNAASSLIEAIHEVRKGNTYLSPGISRLVIEASRADDGPDAEPLSGRERQVLQLVAEGMSTKAIAEVLSISVKTAESHRTRIMQKLDIHDTASLVLYAIRRGIIQP